LVDEIHASVIISFCGVCSEAARFIASYRASVDHDIALVVSGFLFSPFEAADVLRRIRHIAQMVAICDVVFEFG